MNESPEAILKTTAENLRVLSERTEAALRSFQSFSAEVNKAKLEQIYVGLYELLIHMTDYGSIHGGTLQSRKLIDLTKELGNIVNGKDGEIKR